MVDRKGKVSVAEQESDNRWSVRRVAALIAIVVLVAAAMTVAVRHLSGSRSIVETTNAYVAANVLHVTPQIQGTVVAVNAVDSQRVPAGFPLVELDRADAHVALQRAEADLIQVVRQTRGLLANDAAYAGRLEQREAELQRAQDAVNRIEPLRQRGLVAEDTAMDAEAALRSAVAAVSAARAELNAHRALIRSEGLNSHPAVKSAAALVAEAWLNLERTVIRAPQAGVVARRVVQPGARVNPGERLLMLIPLDQVWVDANFKENQLASLRIGQPVTLTADVFGADVVFSGRISGFGAGTGSSFALLPAQNATGNWIKTVQRVPVRIALDPQALASYPLLVGLSMRVKVDASDRSGAPLSTATVATPASTANSELLDQAYAHVARIISSNSIR